MGLYILLMYTLLTTKLVMVIHKAHIKRILLRSLPDASLRLALSI